MVLSAALLFSFVELIDAHGQMVWPPPRQKGTTNFEVAGEERIGCNPADMACNFSNGKDKARPKMPGKKGTKRWELITDVDPLMAPGLTNKVHTNVAFTAPGTSAVLHPCGRKLRDAKGKSGLDFPIKKMVKWQRGTVQEVAWTAMHNHEGGYSYRLLKVPNNPKAVKELDFQKNTLEFVNNVSIARTITGKEYEVPTRRAFVWANNQRQQWSMNPIPEAPTQTRSGGVRRRPPNKYEFGLPDKIKYPRDFWNNMKDEISSWQPYWNWKFSLIDKVQIPENLEPGHYYLSWRWDAGNAPQNFNNCADINIVVDGDSDPLPAHGDYPDVLNIDHSSMTGKSPEPEPESEDENEDEDEDESNNKNSRKPPSKKRSNLVEASAHSGKMVMKGGQVMRAVAQHDGQLNMEEEQ